MAQREDFESNIRTAPKEAASRDDQGEEKRNHGLIVYDRAGAVDFACGRKLLI